MPSITGSVGLTVQGEFKERELVGSRGQGMKGEKGETKDAYCGHIRAGGLRVPLCHLLVMGKR